MTKTVKKKATAKKKTVTKKKEPIKTGRPTKYKEEYADLAYKYCLLGADDKRLAELFETSEQTINAWKKKQPKFLEAITNGKDKADSEIAESLYHRAKGYQHESEEIKVIEGKVIRVPIVKQYPPDTAAAFIWLKNRQSQKWRDKREEHRTEEKTVTINVVDDFISRISGIASRRTETGGDKKLN